MTKTEPKSPMKPAVISISSHVARGSVGNRSAVFALETLGYPVWSVPTVILPYHPGHGQAQRIIPEPEQFRIFLDDLVNSPWIDEVQAVLSGFMANASQALAVADMVNQLKQRNPQLTYLCDPVMGDAAGLYIPVETANAMRDHLLPIADITTPNLHELAWLAGRDETGDIGTIATMAAKLGPRRSIVTSAPAFMRGNIGNLSVSSESVIMAEHRRVDGPTNGSGDMFSALYLAQDLAGVPGEKALERASASVFEINARAAARGADELMPETDSASIIRPMAMVSMRKLANAVPEIG